MNLVDDFKNAIGRSKELTKKPSNEELRDLYALFKQATHGDNQQERQGGFDFKAIAKHDAWASKKGKTQEQVTQDYVSLVNNLYQQYH